MEEDEEMEAGKIKDGVRKHYTYTVDFMKKVPTATCAGIDR